MAEIDWPATAGSGQLIFAQNASSIGGDPNRRAVVDGLRLGFGSRSREPDPAELRHQG